jgi:uncharacterized protein
MMLHTPTVDTLLALTRASAAASLFPDSQDHGIGHWQGVAEQAVWMADAFGMGIEGRVFGFVFGAVHDCRRVNDGYDPEHGERAAAWLGTEGWMDRLGIGHLTPTMVASLNGHDKGCTTEDLLEGLGWDADRSLLGRVGVQPDRRFFSVASSFGAFNALVGRADRVVLTPACWTALAQRAVA